MLKKNLLSIIYYIFANAMMLFLYFFIPLLGIDTTNTAIGLLILLFIIVVVIGFLILVIKNTKRNTDISIFQFLIPLFFSLSMTVIYPLLFINSNISSDGFHNTIYVILFSSLEMFALLYLYKYFKNKSVSSGRKGFKTLANVILIWFGIACIIINLLLIISLFIPISNLDILYKFIWKSEIISSLYH
jgi:hypothetical protein